MERELIAIKKTKMGDCLVRVGQFRCRPATDKDYNKHIYGLALENAKKGEPVKVLTADEPIAVEPIESTKIIPAANKYPDFPRDVWVVGAISSICSPFLLGRIAGMLLLILYVYLTRNK